MEFLSLHFPDKKLEALFRDSLNQPKFEKYLETLIACAFILISFPLTTGVVISVGFFCFSTLLLHFPNLFKINLKSCCIIGLSISLLYSLKSYSIDLKIEVNSQDFMLFALIELLLANQAPFLEGKIMTFIILLSLKFGIITSQILTGEILLKSILYGILLIYVFYCLEKRQRDLFKSQYETQKELIQLKVALQKLISPCLTVLDWNGEKSLFQNKAFDMLLESFENKSSNPLVSFLKSLQINNGINLKDFLQGVQSAISDSDAWLLSGSYKTQEKLHFFDITIIPILWNKTPSLLLALENVTHKKELSILQRVQQDKNLLIATVSHELRTPLHGVLGFIQIVEPKIKEQETLEYLSLCKDNANLSLNLVNSLLDNQQIHHGKMKLSPSTVHIQTLIKNVIALFSFQANNKNIKLSASIQDDIPPHLFTDENRLKQVLINLVSNALKFTVSGSITLRISKQDQNHLRFSVSDTGRGIKKDDLNKIFATYTKLEDKGGQNKHVIGLGLAISNDIVKLLCHGQGGITVESQYGSGSTFSFLVHQSLNKVLFPQKNHSLALIKDYLQQPPMENIQDFEESTKPINLTSKLSFYTSTTHPSNSKDSSLHPKKEISTSQELTPKRNKSAPINVSKMTKPEPRLLLVVDDNYYNLLVAKNLLESLGYHVQTALSGQEAIEKFEFSTQQGLSFFCILVDCQMPLLDGFETTKMLKRIMEALEIEAVPIIALTESPDERTVQKCFTSGMAEFLCKPLGKEYLLKVLSQIESQK